VRDIQKCCVRSWLSLLGSNASTNAMDIQMLGIVTIEIVLAPASMLILGSDHDATRYGAPLPANTSRVYRQQGGRTTVRPANFRDNADALAAEQLDYRLSYLEFRIVRYLMPPTSEFGRIHSPTLNCYLKPVRPLLCSLCARDRSCCCLGRTHTGTHVRVGVPPFPVPGD
jgi:hypothetical protein